MIRIRQIFILSIYQNYLKIKYPNLAEIAKMKYLLFAILLIPSSVICFSDFLNFSTIDLLLFFVPMSLFTGLSFWCDRFVTRSLEDVKMIYVSNRMDPDVEASVRERIYQCWDDRLILNLQSEIGFIDFRVGDSEFDDGGVARVFFGKEPIYYCRLRSGDVYYLKG
jgi:hypothetical protein